MCRAVDLLGQQASDCFTVIGDRRHGEVEVDREPSVCAGEVFAERCPALEHDEFVENSPLVQVGEQEVLCDVENGVGRTDRSSLRHVPCEVAGHDRRGTRRVAVRPP